MSRHHNTDDEFADIQELDVYRTALAASDSLVFIWELGSDKITLFCLNEELFLAIDAKEILSGEHWLTRVHPDDKQQILDKNGQLISGRQQQIHFTYRLLNKQSGKWMWLSAHSRIYKYLANGQVRSIIGTCDIMSSEKHPLDELQKKSARIATAFEGTLDTTWDWDLNNDQVEISDSWKELIELGPKDRQLTSHLWMQRVHPDDRENTLTALFKALRNNTDGISYEHRILFKDGLYHWALIRGHITERLANGRATRATGLLINIDRLKKQDQILKKQQQTINLGLYSTSSSLIEFDFKQQTFTISAYDLHAGEINLYTQQYPLTQASEHIHPKDIEAFQQFLQRIEFSDQDDTKNQARWRSKRQTGQYRWYSINVHVTERATDGSPLAAIGIRQDIHDSYESEYQRLLEHQRESIAYQHSMHAVWEFHPQSEHVFFSNHFIDKLQPIGIDSPWDSSLNYCLHCIHPDDVARVKQQLKQQLQAANAIIDLTYRFHTQKGEWIWIRAEGRVTEYDTKQQVSKVIGTLIDITDLKRSESELEKEKELAQTTLESINEAVITTDENGDICTLNHKAEQLLSTSQDQAKGLALSAICSLSEEDSNSGDYNPIALCLQGDLAFTLNKLMLTNTSKNSFYVECSVSPLHSHDEAVVGCVLVVRDVSQSRKTTHEIEHRAQHDALTGIFNRHAFEAALEANTQTEYYQHSLCYIDLDQFKIVNDTCGHLAGDELLRQITHELSATIRQSDIFARLGGDEFGILMLNCNTERALKISHKIKQTVSDYTFHWQNKTFRLGASIGIAEINQDISASLALQHADTACFSAKDQGRNRIHVFSFDDATITTTQGHMSWVPRLHKALKEDHFELYVQAIRSLQTATSEDSHFEILLRLNDAGKTTPPGAFLPAAERYNLSAQIDRWVISNTLHTLSAYRQHTKISDTFNINLSAASLSEPGFFDFVSSSLLNSKLCPSQVCFEITETAAVTNLTAAHTLITELKKMGCQFALDDFGSGLSSFGYLKSFPVDYLKIDGAFVKDLIDDPIDAAMVKSINEIGQIMGKKTVAEFVENQAIADVLREMGVDYAQGYHFSVPSPFAEFLSKRPKKNDD